MRLFTLLLFASFGLINFAQNSGQGSQSLASYTFKANYMDAYLFRGQTLHDEDTYQGEFTFGIGQFSYDLLYTRPADEDLAVFDDEWNHSFSYTTISGNRVTSIGYTYYTYGGDRPETQELFTQIRYLNNWNPTYGIFYDFDTYKGYFANFGFSRMFPVTRKSQLEFGVTGWLALDLDPDLDDFGEVLEPGFYEDDGLTNAIASLFYEWQPATWFSWRAGVKYHYAFDDALFAAENIEKDTTVVHSTLRIRFP